MSALVPIESIPLELRKHMVDDLVVRSQPKAGKNAKYAKKVVFNTYDIVDDDLVAIPFSHYYQQLNMGFPNAEHAAPTMEAKFHIPLFERQKRIRQESLEILNETHSVLLSLYCGYGKCLAPGTPILMWDGSTKMAKDVQIEDLLIGDDSTPRRVLSTCRGREQMYRIRQNKGDTYTVNEPHILSLRVSGHKTIHWCESSHYYRVNWFDRIERRIRHKVFTVGPERGDRPTCLASAQEFLSGIDDDDVLDISVKDYLRLNPETKSALKGFKVPVDWPAQVVFMDPYLLGCWLGDGDSSGQGFTNIDQPILDEFRHKLAPMDCQMTRKDDCHYGIQDLERGRSNTWKGSLRDYGLINNKHIPRPFLINCRHARLELLAGLIDTDGYYHAGCYEITQKNKRLSDDILYLVRSLGFNALQKEVRKACVKPDGERVWGTYHLIGFSGAGVDEIPCRLERKRAPPRRINKDALLTAIEVTPVGEGDYCGFVLDGNHRFLLGDFTVTHNTLYSLYLACKIGYKTLIVCHRVRLIIQWKESILKACGPDTKVQVVGGKDEVDPDTDFYIINAVTLPKRDRYDFFHVKTMIADEAHTLCTEKYSRGFNYVFPQYLIGLTATPLRSDGQDKVIELFIGPNMIYRPLRANFNAYLLKTGFRPVVGKNAAGDLDWNSVLASQAGDTGRNTTIVNLCRYFCRRNILVLCKRKDQARIIHAGLLKYGEDVTVFMGSTKILNLESRIVISTCSKSGVGFDHQKLDMLILASDVEENFVQYLGRVFRRDDQCPIILDMIDNFRPLQTHAQSRTKIYEDAGGCIRNFGNYFPTFRGWSDVFRTDLSDLVGVGTA